MRILVAEDEDITRDNIIESLAEEGHSATGARDGREATEALERERFDLLITDLKMPGLGGMELLEDARAKWPEMLAIVITGYGSVSSAVEAMRKGAADYITKPFDLDDLAVRVRKIEERNALRKENIALKTYFNFENDINMVAASPGMKHIVKTIEQIRDSQFNVLLTGETGVGKGLVARTIHFTGPRRDKPFLAVNCATFTEELLASELFGYERGAFTGAVNAKPGLIEVADTGTLFLDEISEMSPALQAKLLRVLEDCEFMRVGGTRAMRADVRFIAATNQNIKQLIAERGFRADLYYRLNTMEIFIPPLRERTEDIDPLCRFFLKKHLPKYSKKITAISEDAMRVLMGYTFPGNVRELENIVERAIIVEQGPQITPSSLPQGITMHRVETFRADEIKPVDTVVKEYAEKVVKSLGGNRTRAAEILGISRTSLWKILKGE